MTFYLMNCRPGLALICSTEALRCLVSELQQESLTCRITKDNVSDVIVNLFLSVYVAKIRRNSFVFLEI